MTIWTLRIVVIACALSIGGCTADPGYNTGAGMALGAAGGAAMGCLLTGPLCPAGAVIGGVAAGALAGGAMGAASTPPPGYYPPPSAYYYSP